MTMKYTKPIVFLCLGIIFILMGLFVTKDSFTHVVGIMIMVVSIIMFWQNYKKSG